MTGSGTLISAMVTGVEGNRALLQADRPEPGCGRCHEPGGCGGGLINAQHTGHPVEFSVINSIGAMTGDRVLVEMSPGGLFKAVVLTYGCATLLAILGAALGTAFFENDAAAIFGAVLGLAISIAVSRRGGQHFKTPVMVLVRPPSDSIHPCHLEET